MEISTHDKFPQPTRAVNELWQRNFTFFKVMHCGWYYLSTVLDDYSCFVLLWRLFQGILANDIRLALAEKIVKVYM
jgi:putative transposase